MTLEIQQLLLQDLSARLQYGVMLKTDNVFPQKLEGISFVKDTFLFWVSDGGFTLENMECKPYLFPLSSMTEEQKEELMNICGERIGFNSGTFISFNGYGEVPIECVNDVIDWLNANYFDYLGLIEKGLAIDATNLNIY